MNTESISSWLTTSWMEEGFEKGRLEGIEMGRVEARIERLVLRQLKKKIGPLNDDHVKKIESLPGEQLERLAVDLLNFSKHDDLAKWLEKAN